MIYRKAIIEEALRWEGTPFQRGALVLGVGGDCCSVLWMIYHRHIGVEPWTPYNHPPGRYVNLFSGQWELHTKEELLRAALREYLPALREIAPEAAQPGDVFILGTPGQPANHAAYLLPDAMILHARIDPRRKTRGATIMRERRHLAFEKMIRTAFVLEALEESAHV